MPDTRKESLKTSDDDNSQITVIIRNELKQLFRDFKEDFRKEMIEAINNSVTETVQAALNEIGKRVTSIESQIACFDY